MQSVSRENINILGGHKIGHSKQKIVHVHVSSFQTVSEIRTTDIIARIKEPQVRLKYVLIGKLYQSHV
jgi:hypothetical protein